MYTTAIFITITTGLLQVIRKASKIDIGFLPLISIIVGIGLAFLGQDKLGMTIKETIWFGIIVGLSASGLFSSVKNTPYVAKQIFKRIPKNSKK